MDLINLRIAYTSFIEAKDDLIYAIYDYEISNDEVETMYTNYMKLRKSVLTNCQRFYKELSELVGYTVDDIDSAMDALKELEGK